MAEFARVIARSGLRFRASPRDGATLKVLTDGEQVEVLGRETWLRVRRGDEIGFVLADHVEPVEGVVTPSSASFAAPAAAPVVPPSATRRFTPTANLITYAGSDVFRGQLIRIDEEFLPDLQEIERLARGQGLALVVTSSLREPTKPVANAIVAPARFSNHHVGHAIDMNVLLGEQLFNSTALANEAALPPRVRQLFADIRSSSRGLRWGKDFNPPDPVHLDNRLNIDHKEIFQAKLSKLWGVSP